MLTVIAIVLICWIDMIRLQLEKSLVCISVLFVSSCNELNLPSEGARTAQEKLKSFFRLFQINFLIVNVYTKEVNNILSTYESPVRVTRAQEKKVNNFCYGL
jgi:hypothetical protein